MKNPLFAGGITLLFACMAVQAGPIVYASAGNNLYAVDVSTGASTFLLTGAYVTDPVLYMSVAEPNGKIFYNNGGQIELYDPSTGQTTANGFSGDQYLSLSPDGMAVYGGEAATLDKFDLTGNVTAQKSEGFCCIIAGTAFDDAGNLFAEFVGRGSVGGTVAQLDPSTGDVLNSKTISGSPYLVGPLAWDSYSQKLYTSKTINSSANDLIYTVDPATLTFSELLAPGVPVTAIDSNGQGDLFFGTGTSIEEYNLVTDQLTTVANDHNYTYLSPLVGAGSPGSVTPEPSTLLLTGIGAVGLIVARRRRVTQPCALCRWWQR
jgi:hypothetical protein